MTLEEFKDLIKEDGTLFINDYNISFVTTPTGSITEHSWSGNGKRSESFATFQEAVLDCYLNIPVSIERLPDPSVISWTSFQNWDIHDQWYFLANAVITDNHPYWLKEFQTNFENKRSFFYRDREKEKCLSAIITYASKQGNVPKMVIDKIEDCTYLPFSHPSPEDLVELYEIHGSDDIWHQIWIDTLDFMKKAIERKFDL